MKKVGTLTFNRAINYGAILQALALKEKLGTYAETEIINYAQPYIESVYSYKDNKIKEFIRSMFFGKRDEKFHKIINEISSEKRYEKSDLGQVNYEKIIVGSDQVWNYGCTENDESFLLPNIETKKYSYAASFGVSRLPEKQVEFFREQLSKFRYISVREKTGQNICKEQLGLAAEVVLDPTLLLTKEEWRELLNIQSNNKKYILFYAFGSNKNLLATAKRLSKLTGLPIYNISVRVNDFFGNKVIKSAGPKDWVELFYNAAFVVTDSFHATAFSINFNKPFYSFSYNKRGSRITDLLNMLGLQERFNPALEDVNLSMEADYNPINRKLEEERKRSLAFIQKIIND